MDESDLKRDDPKRTGLELDKIVLETAKGGLQNVVDLWPSKLESDIERLNAETDPYKKVILSYKVEQKKVLIRVIETYQNEIYKQNKDDVL